MARHRVETDGVENDTSTIVYGLNSITVNGWGETINMNGEVITIAYREIAATRERAH